MKKEIYIIRHGETEYNHKGIVQGRGVDSSLNEKGKQQAAQFYRAYQNEGFQKIYLSQLQRTAQTVEQFIQDNIPVEIHEGLDEISWGIHEGKSDGNTFQQFYKILHRWQEGELDLKIENGESPEDVQKRQTDFLKILEHDEKDKILICTHGRALRILLCTMLGKPLENMEQFPHQNVCLYKLNFHHAAYTVELFNDITHLEK